jgi:AcrR family transcriptional regulator
VKSPAAANESGTRSRTRRAILDSAVTLLAHNRRATLAEIAEAAEVGRSTLHRYFSDREELIGSVVEDSMRQMIEAHEGAELDQGPTLEAMRRLIAAMVELGDQIQFLFADPQVLEGRETPADWADDKGMTTFIRKGQQEGVFDPEVSPEWIQNVMWAVVYTGIEMANQGALARHQVTPTVIRTFENGVRVRQPRS